MNPAIRDWHGKRVWVIGASTGIGGETARLLLAKGARVALSARRRAELEEIAGDNPDALVTVLDIVDHASVLAARDAVLAKWQGIDLVLVVAGGYNEMRADEFDLKVANQLVDLNLRGVLNCLDAVLPGLLKQAGGGIGIVGSVAGYSGLPKALIYGPTKAAIINLCESLYLDLRPRGIAVYMINPGFVKTPLTANNDFKMPALLSAPEAAAALVAGLEKGAFHIHFPHRFTNWLRFARLLPYRWYFALIHRVTGL
ncbi:MAG: SDR family NAD(P)-dependent oxidoreductase [Pseudomonadota bacterium]|nr:SDR family NAD(P)-dependent oxidoreductase [Pseudomonadota bacterium]